ncbi:MAG: SWIM zinc finger family protein [Chitinophagaceae bacterium]|nr:SWIM zinc finger family protein [Chitinophagaceae bacterium]
MNLTEEQILALAPDESSKKSGKDLANASKWVTKSFNDQALWGECQGSGSKPYQTQVDLSGIAFKCSCPSRKFPCKHGIGLLLLFSRQKNIFSEAELPAWVNEWLGKRAEKQEKQVEKKDAPVDEAAQLKRQQARVKKVNDGIQELKLWLKDIIRNGILLMPEKGNAYFEGMAKRMVDAQAPGLANMVRQLGAINFYAEGWESIFLEQLSKIYTVAESFLHIDALPDVLQQDIRTGIGFTQSHEELKSQDGITDIWLVLSKQTSEEDNITTEKFWLYGTKTRQHALVLQFIVRGQGGQLSLMPGLFIEAELVFFPSVTPLRALVKKQIAITSAISFSKYNNWLQVAEAETQYSSILPLGGERAYTVQQLKPVQIAGKWWLKDAEGSIMLLQNENKVIWNLLALSGGDALDMTVIGKEKDFEAVGIWKDETYTIL